MMMLAVMYGMMPTANTVNTDLCDALLHVRVVHARRRDRGAEPVQDDDAQGEEDLSPQVDCPQ